MRPSRGRVLQAMGTCAKTLREHRREHPRQEGRRAPFCFPMTARRPFLSKGTSSTLTLPQPHVCQVLGSESDSPMVHLASESTKSSGHCVSTC